MVARPWPGPVAPAEEGVNARLTTGKLPRTMEIGCRHIMLNASDLERAKDFYLSKLGCPLLEDSGHMFAFRAGDVRFSVFGGGKKLSLDEDGPNASVIFCTEDVEPSVTELRAKGVCFEGEIQDAPGFMKFIVMLDPDNNMHYLGQYSSDPLAPVA